jgi:hypothetical protein
MVRSRRVQPQVGTDVQVWDFSVNGQSNSVGVDQLTIEDEKDQLEWIRDA